MDNKITDVLLKQLSNGFKVFPIWYPKENKCACFNTNCQCPAKHPIFKGGHKIASSNIIQIESWQKLIKETCNWAVATGKPSNGHRSIRKLGQKPTTYVCGGRKERFIYRYFRKLCVKSPKACYEETLKYWRNKARHKLIDDMDAAIAKNIHGVEYDFSAGVPEITSEMMSSKTPYKYLLGQYGDLLSAEKALAAGREFLNTDPELVAKMFQSAGPAEQEAMKIGLADALLMQARKSSVDGSTRNVASNLVGSEQYKQIFRRILGKQADGFINDLSSMAKANKNYGIVSRGSSTPEDFESIQQTKNFVTRAGGNFLGMMGEGIDILGAKTNKKRQIDIATLLTNPEALKKALAEEGSRKSLFNINPVDLSGAGGPFANISGPLTSSEKDIYRKTVKQNLLNNLRGSSVNTADGKNVAFGRAGIDKAIGSSNNSNKIKMLENIPEILKKSVQYYPSITKDRTKFDYISAPININGRSKNTLTTLRNNYFYNVNDLDWATKRKLQRVVAETSGSRAEASINSLPNKSKKIKTSIADFLILSARPFNTGRTGVSLADILINRKQEKK